MKLPQIQEGFHTLHDKTSSDISKMGGVFSLVADVFMAVGPVLGFIPQYLLIRKKGVENFSTIICLILLISNILRIFFWYILSTLPTECKARKKIRICATMAKCFDDYRTICSIGALCTVFQLFTYSTVPTLEDMIT